MSVKSTIKHMFLGPSGERAYDIKRGLLSGLKFRVDPDKKSMRLLGLDEREITSDVIKLSTDAKTAFDIGANDGWYSLYFTTCPNIQKVFSFDGSPVVLERMNANLDLNRDKMKVAPQIFQKLVGDRDDQEFIRVDSFLDQIVFPCVLKIDVDGGEMDVFRGAKETLSKDGVRVVLETHSPQLETECKSFLEGLGYKCRIIDNGWYRKFFPESRVIEHNRWMIATR